MITYEGYEGNEYEGNLIVSINGSKIVCDYNFPKNINKNRPKIMLPDLGYELLTEREDILDFNDIALSFIKMVRKDFDEKVTVH